MAPVVEGMVRFEILRDGTVTIADVALMNDALATNPDRRTALAHFALQMSPHDAALLREALDQALRGPEAEADR